MYKFVGITLLLLAFYSVCAGVVIKSSIRNLRGIPVEDVTITDGSKRVYSLADGSFTISTQADSLYISKLGFEKTVLSTQRIPEILVLSDRAINLPPVRILSSYRENSSPALDAGTIFIDTDSKPASVAEALKQNSSLGTSDVLLTGERQTLSILGNISRHTLVMLGDVVLNPGGEAFDLSSIKMDDIERIEIIKGNASLYGGANAIGGIVKLYSKKSRYTKGLNAESGLSLGSFGLWRNRYLAEYRRGSRHIRAEYTGYTADNDFPYQPRPWWNMSGKLIRSNNSKCSDAVSISLGLDKESWSCGYTINGEHYLRSLPGPVNFLNLYDSAKLDGIRLNQTAEFSYGKTTLNESLSGWINTDKTVYQNLCSTNPVYLSDNTHRLLSNGIKSQTSYVYKQYKFDYMAEVSNQRFSFADKINPPSSIQPHNRLLLATSLRAEDRFDFSWGDYTIAGGIRFDKADDFTGFSSWRVEQQLKLQSLVDVRFGHTVGTAFALPSFYDLFWKGDTQSMGNPDLKPETSSGQSIWSSMEYRFFSLKAAVYHNSIHDLIQWRQVYLFGTVWKPVNVRSAEITSKELEFGLHPWKDISFTGNAAGVLALDKSRSSNGLTSPTFNKKLIYTPDWRLTGRISYRKPFAGADVSVSYIGHQYSTPDNQISPLPDVILYNASVFGKLSFERFALQSDIKLNNIFDKQYEVYVYVPQPGFNWNCGLEITYKW